MKFSAALVDILTKTKPKTKRYDRIKFVRGKIIRNKIPAESEREREFKRVRVGVRVGGRLRLSLRLSVLHLPCDDG